MKAKVLSLEKQPISEIELPKIFETEFRPDVIKRAVLAAQSARIQPWGPDEMAGKRTSAETWGKGFGVARVRRVKGTRHPAAGRGAFAPFTVGGRRAHPPRVEKKLVEEINRKERRLAIRSAIAATKDKKLVKMRGHVWEGEIDFPIIVSDEIEKITKTSELREVLKKLGVWKDVERAAEKKVRAGRGKMRGRKYRKKVGPLLVARDARNLRKSASNLPGVDVCPVHLLNAEKLAPGGVAGRLTIWSKGAIEKLSEGMFL
ncbi:MAG: 50S ribosomal protein L4 [Candidatus Hadarchaeales archaeon]